MVALKALASPISRLSRDLGAPQEFLEAVVEFTHNSPCRLTTKLTGGNGAQRNCRPVQRLVSAYFHSLLRGARPNLLEVPLTGLLSDTQAPSPLLLIFLSNTDPPIFVLASQ